MLVFVQSIEELPTGCSIVVIVSVRAIKKIVTLSTASVPGQK